MSNSESASTSTIEQIAEIEVSTSKVTGNSMEEFYKLRNNLFLSTILIALVGFSLTWCFYTWQTSLNYLIGTCFGLVYLKMLARAVEKIGGKKKGFVLTRFAIFVGLMIVAFKRQELEVIPIFIGFITYKMAILLYLFPLNLLGNRNKSEQKS